MAVPTALTAKIDILKSLYAISSLAQPNTKYLLLLPPPRIYSYSSTVVEGAMPVVCQDSVVMIVEATCNGGQKFSD